MQLLVLLILTTFAGSLTYLEHSGLEIGPAPQRHLEVHVTDDAQRPLANARVQLSHGPSGSTDKDGVYRFPYKKLPDPLALAVTAPKHWPFQKKLKPPLSPATSKDATPPSPHTLRLHVVLAPWPRIPVVLTDHQSGLPVPQGSVEFECGAKCMF